VVQSDQGPGFTAEVTKLLYAACGVKGRYSTAWRPQSQALAERFNKVMATFLTHYVSNDQENWPSLLPKLRMAYNSSVQSTLGCSPFFATFGRHPRLPCFQFATADELPVCFSRWSYLVALHRQTAERTAEKHGTTTEFEVGDQVMMSAIPKAETEDGVKLCRKLCQKFRGPYEVVQKHGVLNYSVNVRGGHDDATQLERTMQGKILFPEEIATEEVWTEAVTHELAAPEHAPRGVRKGERGPPRAKLVATITKGKVIATNHGASESNSDRAAIYDPSAHDAARSG